MKQYHDQSASIVGVGISSIMIALRLCAEQYKITVYTKGPDPRTMPEAEHFSSTGNGRMGRFITGFEGQPYVSNSLMYPNMQWAFQHTVAEGGWLAKPISAFSLEDQIWLQKRYAATNDTQATKTLFENYYVKHNRESIQAWQALYLACPDLFNKTDITNPWHGVLRLYDNIALFQYAKTIHQQYGFLKETLSSTSVARRFPAFAKACSNGLVAGGIIVEGFSLNILRFVNNAITYLESSGVTFRWNTQINDIVVDAAGVVNGLRTNSDEMIVSKHYSINPGAYGNDLLNTTRVRGTLGGVAGRWLVMPRPEGYNMPTKIHGDKRPGFPVTDINLTPFVQAGKKMLAVGGGYVYVGSNLEEYGEQLAYDLVDRENARIMKLYFGKFYQTAKQRGEVVFWDKACVRSFSYDDQPVHEVLPTAQGGWLTITAGTNTGTTTLAPYLANWTLDVFGYTK